MSELFTIVAAAGRGTRLGADVNKIFVNIAGTPLLVHTLKALNACSSCKKMFIVVAPDELSYARDLLAHYKNDFFPELDYEFVRGGSERQESVYNALKNVPLEYKYVAVHDGARPFIEPEVFEKVFSVAQQKGAAIAGINYKDTLKITRNSLIEKTLDRDHVFAAQTPQIFSVNILQAAYEKSIKENFFGTDDASLVEHLGYRITIVQGQEDNIKITTKKDLFLAKIILGERDELSRRHRV